MEEDEDGLVGESERKAKWQFSMGLHRS